MEEDEKVFQFEGGFGRPHPLLVPSIIREVMTYLSFKHLKTCRLICQEWEQEAYRFLRGRTLVRINNYKRLKDYLHSFEHRKDFCASFDVGRALNIGAPLMVAFFNDYGSHIKSLALERTKWKEDQLSDLIFKKLVNLNTLTLDCVVPRGDDKGRYFQSQLPQQLLKLKHLNIDVHAWESNYEIHPASKIKTFLLDIFSVAPNLECIACPKSDANYQPLEFLFPMDPVHVNHFINGEVLDALDELNGMGFESNIRRVLFDTLVGSDSSAPKLRNLAELDVSMTLREEHIRKLQLKIFPLQRLDIIVTQNVTLVTLHNFLCSLSHTLHSLSLRFLRRSLCTWEFPSAASLRNLRFLKMTGFKGSVHFVQNFTQLETLIVVKIPKLSIAFQTNAVDYPVPLRMMRALEVFEVEKLSSQTIHRVLIQQWATNFPNLTKLRLDNICDITLRAIYSEMKGLEELIARNGDFTDSGLTGIPPEKCEALLASADFNTILDENILPLASISSLKHLKKLELGSKNMTDVGIIYGVTKCESLKCLSLMTYWMTDQSLRKIAEIMNLESLKTEFCNQLTLDIVNFLLDKMKGCNLSINEYEGPMKSSDMWKFLKRNNNLKVALNKLPQHSAELDV